MKSCQQFSQKYVVQGGLTGLAGGASVQPGEVVISLALMDQIEEIDMVGGTALVQAGVVLETIHKVVEAKSWYFPLDLGARGSRTIGGNVSTNAGGNRVLRYGTTRHLVLGLEVVLPDGTVLNMLRRLVKNSAGADLNQQFIGTEGRYGVVTRVMLRLMPLPEKRLTALLGVNSFEQLVELLKRARLSLPDLSSFEVMWHSYVTAASKVRNRAVPFDGQYPLYVLIEVEGRDTANFDDRFNAFLEQVIDQQLIADAIIPHSMEQAVQMWDMRDAIGTLLRQPRLFLAYDVSLPLKQMQVFIKECMTKLETTYPHIETLLFGHLGDGNLHMVTFDLYESEIFAVEELVYQIVGQYNGSISAEHGIGMIKKPFLHYSRNPAEIKQMKLIRQLLNPQDLLNNGRVID